MRVPGRYLQGSLSDSRWAASRTPLESPLPAAPSTLREVHAAEEGLEAGVGAEGRQILERLHPARVLGKFFTVFVLKVCA